MDSKIKKNINISNKKALFLYNILKKYVAGIVLNGTEVKAVRMSNVSINEAFCYFKKSELYVKNMNISEYSLGTYLNHKPNRERKLLLNKKELKILENKIKERGFTIIPIELKMSETGFVKLEIGLAQGKKVFDKRQSIKEKDNKRELDRLKKLF
jgi:SsrA-binding protein